MPFDFQKTGIKNILIIIPKVFDDNRGFFFESYKKSDFKKAGIVEDFVQDNQSYSVKNTIRGLHFQRDPHSQGKLVRCIQGSIWDVAVDLRKESETYGKYFSIELTDENKKMLYIPAGFAHGFLAFSETAQINYKCTSEYNSFADGGINWNDPYLNISWPVKKEDVIISTKDNNLPYIKEFDKDIQL